MNFSNIFASIQSQLQSALQSITGTLAGQLMSSVNAVLNGESNTAQLASVFHTLQAILGNANSVLLNKIKEIYIKYQAQIQQLLAAINQPKLLVARMNAKAEMEKSLQEWFDCVENAFNTAVNHVLAAGISVVNWFNGKRGLNDILAGITSTLGGHLDNITSSLAQVGSSLLDAVTPHLQDLQDQLTNHALNAAQSLLGTLAGISGTLQG